MDTIRHKPMKLLVNQCVAVRPMFIFCLISTKHQFERWLWIILIQLPIGYAQMLCLPEVGWLIGRTDSIGQRL
jgi:hypothetical protein